MVFKVQVQNKTDTCVGQIQKVEMEAKRKKVWKKERKKKEPFSREEEHDFCILRMLQREADDEAETQ